MATRLKKLTRNVLLKVIMFILILSCSVVFMLSFYNIKDVKYFESILQPDFMQSEESGYLLNKPTRNVYNLLWFYDDKEEYEQILQYFERTDGIYFYATNGVNVVKNVNNSNKDFFTSQKSYLIVEGHDLYYYPTNISRHINDIFYGDLHNSTDNNQFKLYVALTDEYLDPIITEWNENRELLINEISIMGAMFIIALIALIYIIATAGKNESDEEIKLNIIDRLYTDVNLIFIACIIIIGVSASYDMVFYTYDSYIVKYVVSFFVTAVVALCLTLGLSLIRHIKNHTLIKHSFVYTVIYKTYTVFTSLFASGPMMLKAIILVVGFGLACMLGTVLLPLGLLVIAVGIYFVYINVNRFKQIKYCVKSVKEGELSYKTNINGNGELARFSRDINSIAEGLEKAVRNEVKSERMKSELITNVSHDIKTPLTSIINYVDLLKKEGLDSENAPKYLDILEQKSQRLKVLTEDLFEAAKASSGDMPVNLEKVDIFSLMQQGLAELDDKIEQSGLHFKINVPDEKIYVLADGRLLWRVIENLLSNVFKYSLKGSRVYIDIIDSEDSNENVVLSIKNISSYELNIAVDELMERFKRADESRNSEGSGLGLAIAKNLMEIQKGSLNLEIDGDLFKATISVPKYKEL